MDIHPLDLVHHGLPGAISAYFVDGEEPVLVDPGPSTCLEALEDRLSELGLAVAHIRHIALTHVHLDHAGATGHLVRRVPGLRVHVHEDGAPHMADPERLVASTRRTFGAAHDELWGEVAPVPPSAIVAWRPGEVGRVPSLRPFHTPGHIDHHVAWLDEESGTLLAGDTMGVLLAPGAPPHPPTPAPGADLDAWRGTLKALEAIGPERFGAAHFGLHGSVADRIRDLGEALTGLQDRIEAAVAGGRDEEDAEAYEEDVRTALAEHLPRSRVDRYFDTFRAATDYRGARRWLLRRLS